MTAQQVFLWYCKDKGILGDLITIYRLKQPKKWEIGSFFPTDVKFEDYFGNICKQSGLINIFSYFPSYSKSKKYINAQKRWNYFVKNNIVLDTTLNEGDEVEINTWSRTRIYYLISFDYTTNNLKLSTSNRDLTTTTNMPLSMVKKINGKQIEFEYHIERKGKKYYGADKR